jgi:hypothetical protein
VNHFGIALGKRESQIAILMEESELINGRLRTERHLSWSKRSYEVAGVRVGSENVRAGADPDADAGCAAR